MPKEFSVPETGTISYQWIQVPSGFTEDKWIQAVEVKPGNRAVVHHAVVYAREEGGDWGKGAPVGEFFNLFSLGIPKRIEGNTMFGQKREPEHLEVFAPGADPIVLAPGQARLIKAGSYIVFEMHYTPTGVAATDRSSVGIVFAEEPAHAESAHDPGPERRTFLDPARRGRLSHRVARAHAARPLDRRLHAAHAPAREVDGVRGHLPRRASPRSCSRFPTTTSTGR